MFETRLHMTQISCLSGLTPAQFLRKHWQKRPLLARGAFPGIGELMAPRDIFELARDERLQSRLVTCYDGIWDVEHGPFTRRTLQQLPSRGWALLVQGLNHAVREAAALLEQFTFLPHARLDDLMVSLAPPGGGVGPHFDSYDVFLLQGPGTRRWQISGQRDLALIPDIPLRILQRFHPAQDWQVATGDSLYLPPRYAHDGVALTQCITYSVGFRAPSAQELGQRFLEFLQDELALDGMYADPDLKPLRGAGAITPAMVTKVAKMLDGIRWNTPDVARFLGAYLTEPKPHIVFERPERPLTAARFTARGRDRGVRLALTTQMLYAGHDVFINGERISVPATAARLIRQLADRRSVPPGTRWDKWSATTLYDWYRCGYIETA